MTKKPAITIVLPDGADVHFRLADLRAQTFQDFEIVRVDGPSPEALFDGTGRGQGAKVAFLSNGWRWHNRFLEEHLEAFNLGRDVDASVSVGSQGTPSSLDALPIPRSGYTLGMLSGVSSSLFAAGLFQRKSIDPELQNLLLQDLLLDSCFAGRVVLILQQLSTGPQPCRESLERDVPKFLKKHRGLLLSKVGEDALEELHRNSAGYLSRHRHPRSLATYQYGLQTLLGKIRVWPFGWGVLAALFLGCASSRHPKVGQPRISPPGDPIAPGSREGSEVIVGSYLTANPCPQRGWNFPRDSFDPIGQWHASLKRLKLAGVLIHDGLDPKIIASHRDPKFRFEQVDIAGDRHVIYLTRFRLYLDFLDNHPEIERLFFTDVTDLVALHSPFPSIEPNKIYVGCEPTSVGASRFMWRIVGLSYGWPGRVRFLSILNKQLLNCGIFGGYRDPVYKLISGVVREMEQILPTADSDMGAFNLVVRECFQDEDIVTDYPLHSCFKRFEPRRDVYFRHK